MTSWHLPPGTRSVAKSSFKSAIPFVLQVAMTNSEVAFVADEIQFRIGRCVTEVQDLCVRAQCALAVLSRCPDLRPIANNVSQAGPRLHRGGSQVSNVVVRTHAPTFRSASICLERFHDRFRSLLSLPVKPSIASDDTGLKCNRVKQVTTKNHVCRRRFVIFHQNCCDQSALRSTSHV